MGLVSGLRASGGVYTRAVTALVKALMVLSGLGILAMIAVVCLDVVLRLLGSPLVGALDIVKMTAALTIASALPYTTAVKGHVAIEYFFQKLSRRGRVVVDTVARSLTIALFGLLTRECFRYGSALRRSGQVTPTLQIPEFWMLYVIGASCGVVVLVIFHNLVHPGREMIKP